MSALIDLTPERLRCTTGFSCPRVMRLADGRLLIIGEIAMHEALEGQIPMGPTEFAVAIDEELLENLKLSASD